MAGVNLGNVSTGIQAASGLVDAISTRSDGTKGLGGAFISGASKASGLMSVNPILGGVAMLGSGLFGLFTQKKKNEELRRQEEERKRQEKELLDKQNTAKANALFAQFPADGVDSSYFGAYGIDLNSMPEVLNGGKLKQIGDSDGAKVIGNSHEQGGVTVTNLGNDKVAEIEGNEVVTEDGKVFSDRLMVPGGNVTFSLQAEKLLAQKNREKHRHRKYSDIKEKDIDEALDTLFQLQTQVRESTNAQQNQQSGIDLQNVAEDIPEYAFGNNPYDILGMKKPIEPGDINTIPIKFDTGFENYRLPEKTSQDINLDNYQKLNNIPISNKSGIKMNFDTSNLLNYTVPFLDNITNAILSSKRKAPPTRKAISTPRINTTYNIGAQLGEIENSLTGTQDEIKRNLSNSNTATAAIIGARANSIQEKNRLYTAKENAESELRNKQTLLTSETEAKNNEIDYENRMMQYKFENNQLSEQSENMANAVQDFRQIIADDRRYGLDLAKLEIGFKNFDDNPAATKELIKLAGSLGKQEKNKVKQMAINSKDQRVIDEWNKMFPNDKIE